MTFCACTISVRRNCCAKRSARKRKFPSFINDIRCSGDRFYVTDAYANPAFFVKYVCEDDQECSMHIFADDVALPRYVTSMLSLDRDTVAVSGQIRQLCRLAPPQRRRFRTKLNRTSPAANMLPYNPPPPPAHSTAPTTNSKRARNFTSATSSAL